MRGYFAIFRSMSEQAKVVMDKEAVLACSYFEGSDMILAVATDWTASAIRTIR